MFRRLPWLLNFWLTQAVNAVCKFANTIVAGYEQPWGTKLQTMLDHTGPVSYSNIGTSSGTGDVIKASDLGRGGFEQISVAFGGFVEGYTASGNFLVKMFTGSTGTTPTVSIPAGQPFPQIVLQWFAASPAFGAIGAEVANGTNLSAETLRFFTTMV